MKVLVTGATGQLGYDVVNMLSEHEVIGIGSKDLDLTDIDSTYKFVKNLKPDVIIHCAAYTKVDDAETNSDICYKVNTISAQVLASACYQIGAKLLYVSTDYVFDGTKNGYYTEFDRVNPLSVYGKSKAAGEKIIRSILPRHFIVRTSWLYGLNGNNFVKTMLRLSKEKDIIKVVNDQKGAPTSTIDLAKGVLRLIQTDNYGTYHGTCKGETTWYDFTRKIFELKNIKTRVEPITTEELGRPAFRPKNSVLRNYMYELTIGDSFRQWEESVEEYLQKL